MLGLAIATQVTAEPPAALRLVSLHAGVSGAMLIALAFRLRQVRAPMIRALSGAWWLRAQAPRAVPSARRKAGMTLSGSAWVNSTAACERRDTCSFSNACDR